MSYVAINPATGETIASYETLDAAGIEKVLATAASTFAQWRQTSFEERSLLMVRAAELLEGELPVIAQLMTSEMGKTFAAAKGEVAKCAMTMRYYAEHAESMLAPEAIASPAKNSGVRFDPLGPVLAVMPWNFPLWQAVRFAAPAIMAGNVGILKHASNVPGCAEFLGNLFTRAGFPAGVFQNAFIAVKDIAGVIHDPRIAAVTLTGSEGAGRAVAAAAGDALKKCVLELGGSDPFIVGESANLDDVIPYAVTARIQNNGQSCIASKRFIVVASQYDAFVERFAAAMTEVALGDPMDGADFRVCGPRCHCACGRFCARSPRILRGAHGLDGCAE